MVGRGGGARKDAGAGVDGSTGRSKLICALPKLSVHCFVISRHLCPCASAFLGNTQVPLTHVRAEYKNLDKIWIILSFFGVF